jgi:hypothetical protein
MVILIQFVNHIESLMHLLGQEIGIRWLVVHSTALFIRSGAFMLAALARLTEKKSYFCGSLAHHTPGHREPIR